MVRDTAEEVETPLPLLTAVSRRQTVVSIILPLYDSVQIKQRNMQFIGSKAQMFEQQQQQQQEDFTVCDKHTKHYFSV